MIPVELLYILTPLALALSIYAVWNLNNRIYANIVIGGFSSSVIWFFLAGNIVTGNVFYTFTDETDTFVDMSIFWVFILVGVVMTLYTLALSVEAIMEKRMEVIGGET